MAIMHGDDNFMVQLLQALGVPTENMARYTITGAPQDVVKIEAEFYADVPDKIADRKVFEVARSEAVEQLAAAVAGGKVRGLELAPGDIVTFTTDRHLNAEARHRIGEQLARYVEPHKVLVVDGGAQIGAIKKADAG